MRDPDKSLIRFYWPYPVLACVSRGCTEESLYAPCIEHGNVCNDITVRTLLQGAISSVKLHVCID